MVQDVATLMNDLAELMSLDCWLSFGGLLPEICDGPSNLFRTMPALVQRIMIDFEVEFEILDRTSKDGGFQIIQDVADSLLELSLSMACRSQNSFSPWSLYFERLRRRCV
ncbi:MAG: hypothetical protein MMC33_001492 [Icmadophila ericetorum]|nr:hypothetical protein [Icmadophila ericetorum]